MGNATSIKYDTLDLWKKDRDHFIHPYTNYDRFKDEGSIIFSEGKEHFIYDTEGKEYLDGMAGLWCVNIGHGRRDIADCMAYQASKMAYYNTFEDASSIPAAELAAKLSEIAPGTLNHVFFGTGGSMANDTAIKMVHYYFNLLGKPDKKFVISRELGYHGSTYLAHTLTGIKSTHIGFDLAPDLVHYLSAPYPLYRPEQMDLSEFANHLIDEFKRKIEDIGADKIACYIAEPILGAGGVIVPPPGYNKRMWDICRANDILYIADEVVTAFGRLGHMVSSKDVFDVQPDILVMAKGISSGYVPLGATMITDEIHDVISQPKKDNPYFSHGFTYSGHALCCAVGLKNIEILEEEGFCDHVLKHGPYFLNELKKLEKHQIIAEVRGSQYMLCLESLADKEQKIAFEDDVRIAKRIYYHCKSRGLMIRPIGSINVLSPPLTYDTDAIDRTVHILDESIKATMDDLTKEGVWNN